MAATKECPSCGTEVPSIAKRCKACFHDFTEVPPARSFTGPLVLLAAFTMMAVMGAAMLGYMATLPTGRTAHVDHDSQSIVFVTKYRQSQQTEQVPWARVGTVEHLTTKNGTFEVNAVLLDGTRRLLAQSATAMGAQAEEFGAAMDKTVEYNDETRVIPGVGSGAAATP